MSSEVAPHPPSTPPELEVAPPPVIDAAEIAPPPERPPITAERVGFVGRWAIGRTLRQEARGLNEGVGTGTRVQVGADAAPDELGTYPNIPEDMVDRSRKGLQVQLKQADKAARSLNKRRDATDAEDTSLGAEVEAHNARLEQLKDVESRARGLQQRVHKRAPLQQRVAQAKILDRRAGGESRTPEGEVKIPEHLLSRSRIARTRAEASGPVPELPITEADLPPQMQTYQAKIILHDLRLRVQEGSNRLVNQGRAADADSAHRRMLQALLGGNFYQAWGIKLLELDSPENYALIEELLSIDDEAFNKLLPKPTVKRTEPRMTKDRRLEAMRESAVRETSEDAPIRTTEVRP